MTSCPKSNGDRATDGKLNTAASASPRVPGILLTSSPASDTRATSSRAGAARTVVSYSA